MIAGSENEIFSLVLNAYHAPIRYQDWWGVNSELPEGTNLLLRIASGETDFAEGFCQAKNIGKKDLQEAAAFFVRQAFFAQGASYYRVMGLNPQADPDQIKEHYRLLMRLFHPDRQHTQGAWTDNFAGRVNQAYNVLRKSDLRQEYDRSLRPSFYESSVSNPEAFIDPSPVPFIPVKQPPPRLPQFKYLPYVVMTGISILAVLFLINAYFTDDYHLTVVAQQDPVIENNWIYSESNNQFQPNKALINRVEPLKTPRDLAEDIESLKIPEKPSAKTSAIKKKPSAETPTIEKIADLKPKKAINNRAPLRAEEPSLPARDVAKKVKPSSTPAVNMLPVSTPTLAKQTKVPEPSATKPANTTTNKQRRNPETEARNLTRTRPTSSDSASSSRKKLTTSNIARISTTYKQSASTKTTKNAKVENNFRKKIVKPKPTIENKTASIANNKEKLKPSFSERDLKSLLGRFVSAYERGDLISLMSLFTEQARAGGKKGKARIRQDYKNLFDNTHSRRISLSNIIWRQAGDVFRGDGQFSIRTSSTGKQGSTQSSGKVSFEVEQRNGRLFIRGFYHQLGG